MKLFVKIWVLAVMAILAYPCEALSETLDENMKRHAAETVGQMNDYISFMANKKKTVAMRQRHAQKALNLFIGKGYEYEENGVNKKGVMMEISSVNRKPKTHRLMRDYFNNLINLGYSDVKIESTEIADIKVSNLQKINDNTYVCTCQFDQAFVGYRDRRPVYRDITTKRVKCYVEVEETENGQEFLIRLGDVSALSTRRE